ncbi:MAG: hypothetical protein RLZZ597_1177 [Cyanobacteriota bacterium]|jgi:diguanylate cyclase (GGDEF)-like protein
MLSSQAMLAGLKTPIWLYTMDSLDLLWANQSALAWMGLTSVDEVAAWAQGPGAGWNSLLWSYRQALSAGQAPLCNGSMGSPAQGISLYCLGSAVTLTNGQAGLLLEGQGLGRSDSNQQAILSAIPDLLIRMTRDGQCLYLHQGTDIDLWCEMPPGQTASVYDLLPPHLADQRLYYAQQALDTGNRQVYRLDIEVRGKAIHEEVRVVPMGQDEVLVIVRDITLMVKAEQQLFAQAERFRQQAQRDRVLAQVTQRISQSLDLQEVLDTAVDELRRMMHTNRVLVYHFEGDDGGGQVIAESVDDPALSLRTVTVEDHCFSVHGSAVRSYRQGRIQRTNDIHNASLPHCYVEMLSQLRVRANLVIPIVQGDHLWGLLTCQQCDLPRDWDDLEVETLAQLANQLAIAIQQSELYQQLQRANEELQHLATHDKLTGLANRRYFDDYLDQEWRRLTRERAFLSLILLDIDYFKPYNDTYGHLAGDACLAQVAKVIRQSIKRPADLAARYGGEEFAIILPNTPLEGAVHTAELICQAIAETRIPHTSSPDQPYITVSIGIASVYPSPTRPSHVLTDLADQALYQAKAQGRDGYVVATSPLVDDHGVDDDPANAH